MVLSEVLSTSFLFSIAIIIILVGGLFAYFNHRFAAQNHKMSSMLALVSTMAEEMQYFRSKLNTKTQEQCKMPDADAIHFAPQSFFLGGNVSNSNDENNLIEVSDGEDDDSDLEEDSDSEEEDDNDSEEEDDSDSESEDSDSSNLEQDNIKNICIDLGNEIDLDIDDELDQDINESVSNTNNTKTINLSEDISSFEITSKTLENINDIDITINLENDEVSKGKIDYKKMSLNKLRDVVIEKGLVVDATKLKKNDILKMLGDE